MPDNFGDGFGVRLGAVIPEANHLSKYHFKPGRAFVAKGMMRAHGAQVADPMASSVSETSIITVANSGTYVNVPLALTYLVITAGRMNLYVRSSSGTLYSIGVVDADASPYLVFGGSNVVVAQTAVSNTKYKWVKLFPEVPY